MKKTTIVIIVVLSVIGLALGAVAAVPAVNDRAAEKLAYELSSPTPPEGTVVIESVSAAGNLTGGGNKMQYFAAILVTSASTAEELVEYYRGVCGDEHVSVKAQTENAIPESDRGNLSFSSTLLEDETYYIIYLWDTSTSFYRNLDIRAH